MPQSKIDPAMRKALTRTLAKRRKKKKAPQASLAVAKLGFSSGFSVLPDRFRSKLRWTESYRDTAGTTDIVNWRSFNLNGLVDPEVAVSPAIQPFNFDQLMTRYNHFKVVSAKITIKVYHEVGNPTVVGLINSDDTTRAFFAGKDEMMVQPDTTWKIVGNYKPYTVLTRTYSANRIYGKTNKGDQLEGDVGNNPTEGYFAHFGHVNLGPTLTQAAVSYNVTIDYVADFFEKKHVAIS